MKLHFSIRDVLWLMLVCGLALGWWLDSRQKALLFAELVHAADRAGYSVHYYGKGPPVLSRYHTVPP